MMTINAWNRVLLSFLVFPLTAAILLVFACSRKTTENDANLVTEVETEEVHVGGIEEAVGATAGTVPDKTVSTHPCTVNGLRLRYVLDVDRPSTAISLADARFMLQNGYLSRKDIEDNVHSSGTDAIEEATKLILREIIVEQAVLKDVPVVVANGLNASVVFGQSEIWQLGNILCPEGGEKKEPWLGLPEAMHLASEVMETDLWREYVSKGWIIQQNGLWDANEEASNVNLLVALGLARARYGAVAGMRLVAELYEKGTALPRDEEEAFKWRRMAAENGDCDSQVNTGFNFYYGQGVQQDRAEAAIWFTKAAEQGDAAAQSNLGKMYLNGEGVRLDEREAAKWFRKGAEAGYAESQAFLGRCYDEGIGVEKDEEKAFYWYQKAAEQEHPIAIWMMGIMYEQGRGTPIQKRKVLEFYRRATEAGIEDARTDYRRLLREKQEHDRTAQMQRGIGQ